MNKLVHDWEQFLFLTHFKVDYNSKLGHVDDTIRPSNSTRTHGNKIGRYLRKREKIAAITPAKIAAVKLCGDA